MWGRIEPPLGMRRTHLSLQFCVKLISTELNPAYSVVFHSDIISTYEEKEKGYQTIRIKD